MLKQRVITAVVLAAVFSFAVVYLPPLILAVVFAIIVLLAAWEWSMLSGLGSTGKRLSYVFLVAVFLTAVSFWCDLGAVQPASVHLRDVIGLGCLWWSVALLLIKFYPASAAIWGSTATRLVLGLMTLVPAWLALVSLRLHDYGIHWLFVLVAVVASADIGAYFSGRAWGKAKLAPNVSPGKSWAGLWGGVVASAAISSLFWWLAGQPFPFLAVLGVAAVTVIGSVLGDLSESMVKRHRGVKDSGAMLPGHGGLLDRIDSLTAAAPVLALSIILLGW